MKNRPKVSSPNPKVKSDQKIKPETIDSGKKNVVPIISLIVAVSSLGISIFNAYDNTSKWSELNQANIIVNDVKPIPVGEASIDSFKKMSIDIVDPLYRHDPTNLNKVLFYYHLVPYTQSREELATRLMTFTMRDLGKAIVENNYKQDSFRSGKRTTLSVRFKNVGKTTATNIVARATVRLKNDSFAQVVKWAELPADIENNLMVQMDMNPDVQFPDLIKFDIQLEYQTIEQKTILYSPKIIWRRRDFGWEIVNSLDE